MMPPLPVSFSRLPLPLPLRGPLAVPAPRGEDQGEVASHQFMYGVGSMYSGFLMTAKGYAASLTISPQNSPLSVSWVAGLKVRLPTGVSNVRPSKAFATLSESVLPAFLIPSASASIDI